ncbi:MAG: nuclease-like protein [Gammaproteobacteria bacterium]|jgi:endonuclease YncB( thermonuclease family)|nr:nuclease-like protein [Gammaproteobacteria bacterium]
MTRTPFPHRTLAQYAQLLLATLLTAATATAAEISSFAFINDDGTLRMRNRTIHLYGIYIPETARTCMTFRRPQTCGSRAALALDFKKGANFVHCEPQEHYADGSINAICTVKGDDLAAYLIERGWAMALPEAPFEYKALERIAERRGIGVWGITLGEPGRPFGR